MKRLLWKFVKRFIWQIIIVIEALIIFLLFPKTGSKEVYVADNVTTEINVEVITNEIRDIGELASVEYAYTDAGKFSKSNQIGGIVIPLTQKSFLVRWDGLIKAGINLEKIKIQVKDISKTIEIKLPEAEILSHEIDNDSFETLDEKNNLFNPITVDDVNSFIEENKAFMEKRVIENGLLDKAIENEKTLLTNLFMSSKLIPDDYTIEIKVASE